MCKINRDLGTRLNTLDECDKFPWLPMFLRPQFIFRKFSPLRASYVIGSFHQFHLPFQHFKYIHLDSNKMAPTSTEMTQARNSGHKDGDIEGTLNEWKFRAPYKVHSNEDFKVLYEAACHCGRVQYQLSREKPLDSKYCHCSTCQLLHGTFISFPLESFSRLGRVSRVEILL